ncbi:MAG: uroporphyrinogen decarboxylase family protein [Planctomycetota bacterium]
MKPRDIFLRKVKREATPRPAVGTGTSIVTMDLMDKVGVFFPEAHLDVEGMTALAAAGHTELGFDNVMPLFSVWHESAALGCEVDWGEKHRMPGSRRPLCGSIADEIRIPPDWLRRPAADVPLKSLALLKKRLGGEVAVVGKVFGPWTLGYHVFGVQEFLISTLLDPGAVHRAMRTLLEVTVLFGRAQVEAGADALLLADHCTRDLCSPEAYRDFLLPVHRELHERLPCPLILHICGETSDRIPYIRASGLECFHYDSKVPDGRARALAGEGLSLMGGTSNLGVIRGGTPERIVREVREKLLHRIDIIGPECAVPLDAPYANMQLLVAETLRQRREEEKSQSPG